MTFLVDILLPLAVFMSRTDFLAFMAVFFLTHAALATHCRLLVPDLRAGKFGIAASAFGLLAMTVRAAQACGFPPQAARNAKKDFLNLL